MKRHVQAAGTVHDSADENLKPPGACGLGVWISWGSIRYLRACHGMATARGTGCWATTHPAPPLNKEKNSQHSWKRHHPFPLILASEDRILSASLTRYMRTSDE